LNAPKDEIERRIGELLASYLETSNLAELEEHGEINGDRRTCRIALSWDQRFQMPLR